LIAAGKRVRVNTVVMQQTNECIEELVQILHDKGVSALTLIPLRPVGEATRNFSKNKLSPDEYRGLVKRVGSLRARYPAFSIATNYDILSTTSQGANVPPYWPKMCMAGIEAACISAEGELRACIVAAGVGVAGSLLESKLYELWHNDERWGIFRNLDRRVLEQCRKCPDYTLKCPGSCIAMTEFSKSPEEMYCFKHLVR
jgi:radical SAM protein with 4Fe4S-binding SPASM domain